LTLLRVVAWPLVGLVTDVPQLAIVLLAVTLGAAVIGLRIAAGAASTGMRWLVWLLGWGTLALAFVAPSLQRVVPGLPNDHYHAFLDPVVILLIAIPAGILFVRASAAWRDTRRPLALAGVVAVGLGVVALELTALSRKPAHVDPNGGWPAMQAAGERILRVADHSPVFVIGLPEFKLPDAIGFPIAHAGGILLNDLGEPVGYPKIPGMTVVACDRLFEGPIGAQCGGPAEDAAVARLTERYSGPGATPPALIERFPASPRTWISIYR
jgi:hypothetical protein